MMSQKTKEMSCRKANIKSYYVIARFLLSSSSVVFARKTLSEFMCHEEEFGIFVIVVGLDTTNGDRSG